MEAKIPKYNNKENLKNLIESIIKKQIGKKLQNLEEKNNSEIKEIKQLSNISTELINNLHNFSRKIKKKHNENKNQKQIINNTKIKSFSPTNMSIKRGKDKKKHINNNINNINNNNRINHFNLKNNLMVKRSLTPLKTSSTIMKKTIVKYKRDIKTPTKHIDIYKKNRNIDNSDNQSKHSYLTNRKKSKTPIRKKNKNYFNNISKTPDHSLMKKNINEFDLASLDYEKEMTKMSINFDENQDRISKELNYMNNARLTIRLGALAEKIENEKLLIDDDIFFPKTFDNFINVIEIIFDNLFSFLDIKSFFNILLLNKAYFNLIIKLLINKLDNKVKNINQYLKDLKSKNESLNLKEEKITKFEYNKGSIRALSTLNSITVENFFSEKKINFEDKNIKLIFDLYFISIGKKKDIITSNFEKGFREKFIMNYFKSNNKNIIGNIIDNEFKQIKFSDEIINSLYEYSLDKLNIISPKNFQRVNKNITWFCYLIKNLMEHIGIINKDNKNRNINQVYNIFCSRLHINKELSKKLKMMSDYY